MKKSPTEMMVDRQRDIQRTDGNEDSPIVSEDGLIIDAGGGVIVRSQNIDSLRKNGIVFWLMADEHTIVDRIKDGMQRPSLSGSKSFVDEVAEILAERTPKYQAAADHTIDTVKNTPAQAAEAIAEIFLAKKG